MDEMTRKRMERAKEREQEVDTELQYIDYYIIPKISLSLTEVINFIWEKTFRGVSRERCKRIFIDEVIDSKITPDLFNEEGEVDE